MHGTDEILTSLEQCQRKAFWALDWKRARIDFHQLLREGIIEGLTSEREDFGQSAGEKIMEVSTSREIYSDQHDIYSLVIHTASLSDVLCHALRKPQEGPWKIPEPTSLPNGLEWVPSVFLAPSGSSLRRVVLVSNWSKDKHYSFCRDWSTIGNVCTFGIPMQLAICVLGQTRDGKRHGYFSKGYQHPVNKGLR